MWAAFIVLKVDQVPFQLKLQFGSWLSREELVEEVRFLLLLVGLAICSPVLQFLASNFSLRSFRCSVSYISLGNDIRISNK